MKTPAPVLPESPADAPVRWRLHIVATAEPLLLARVLQKITVPEIELCAAGYETAAAGPARIGLTLLARPARARLAAIRLQKIIGTQTVTLEPAG